MTLRHAMFPRRHGRLAVAAFVLLAVAAASVGAQDAAELRRLDDLDKRCEAARATALAPVRARLVEQCVAEKRRSRAQCEAESAEHGNTHGTKQGARSGQFYDLPECKAAFEARQKYRQ